jgi:3,4-dihydroxy-2-butanone 4-phosphate synthase
MDEKFTLEQMKDALEKAAGVIVVAANSLHCSRRTITNYLQRHPELKEFLEDLTETNLDIAVSNVYLGIRQRDKFYTVYYLNNKGGSRGYGKWRNREDSKDVGFEQWLEQLNEAREKYEPK